LHLLEHSGTRHLQSTGNDGIKLYVAVMAKNVADRAIQVMGGYGYVGEYNVERLWRDSKLLEIAGGTNEIHHKNMIRDLLRLEIRSVENDCLRGNNTPDCQLTQTPHT